LGAKLSYEALQVTFSNLLTFQLFFKYNRRMDNKVQYWIDIADYDMKTASSMHKAGRYLYSVFMCQQAVEKILKAIFIKNKKQEPPFSHNLIYIHSLLDIKLKAPHVQLLGKLTAYYIEGRYPSYKEYLSGLISKKVSSVTLKETKELYKCLKLTLKS
jgi:HEPN domain-containing protein